MSRERSPQKPCSSERNETVLTDRTVERCYIHSPLPSPPPLSLEDIVSAGTSSQSEDFRTSSRSSTTAHVCQVRGRSAESWDYRQPPERRVRALAKRFDDYDRKFGLFYKRSPSPSPPRPFSQRPSGRPQVTEGSFMEPDFRRPAGGKARVMPCDRRPTTKYDPYMASNTSLRRTVRRSGDVTVSVTSPRRSVTEVMSHTYVGEAVVDSGAKVAPCDARPTCDPCAASNTPLRRSVRQSGDITVSVSSPKRSVTEVTSQAYVGEAVIDTATTPHGRNTGISGVPVPELGAVKKALHEELVASHSVTSAGAHAGSRPEQQSTMKPECWVDTTPLRRIESIRRQLDSDKFLCRRHTHKAYSAPDTWVATQLEQSFSRNEQNFGQQGALDQPVSKQGRLEPETHKRPTLSERFTITITTTSPERRESGQRPSGGS